MIDASTKDLKPERYVQFVCFVIDQAKARDRVVQEVRFDAVPVRYDQRAWLRRFNARWPAGSAAHESYFGRITHGPAFAVERAARPGVEILKAGKVASVQSAHASAKVSYC